MHIFYCFKINKVIFLYLILSFLFLQQIYSQIKYPGVYQYINGDVKQIIKICYEDSSNDKAIKILYKTIYNYNEDHLLTQEIKYEDEKKIRIQQLYFYDDKKDLIKYIMLDGYDKQLLKKFFFKKKDKYNNIIEKKEILYDIKKGTKDESLEKYTFDKDNNTLKKGKIYNNNRLSTILNYKIKNDKVIEIEWISPLGFKIDGLSKMDYDTAGNIIYNEEWGIIEGRSKNLELAIKTIWKYDNNNNQIEILSYNENNELYEYSKHIYTYDENNNIINETVYSKHLINNKYNEEITKFKYEYLF